MRYTLRLLTAQQFQRATRWCARRRWPGCRTRRPGAPSRSGSGCGSGTDVSPKRYDEAEAQLKRANSSGGGYRLTVLQIQRCPWCGSRIGARNVRPDRRNPPGVRVLRRRPGATARSPRAATVPEGLPVLTVDEEIYRLAPAFVIATVDKFARLAREGEAASLFGYVSRRCERHGFVHPDYRHCDIKDGSKHPGQGRFPAAAVRPAPGCGHRT